MRMDPLDRIAWLNAWGRYESARKTSADLEWDCAVVELRDAYSTAVSEFRERHVVEVGPVVTCRGRTISRPVMVPVDERAYRIRALNDQWRALTSAVQTMGDAFKGAFQSIQAGAAKLDKQMFELANDND